jgi:DNA-binding CsgD family transcriptional regulator
VAGDDCQKSRDGILPAGETDRGIAGRVKGKDDSKTEAREILTAIRALPETYKETLILRLVEGMTGQEIAERTNLTPESVRVNLHRGMKLLRQNSASRSSKDEKRLSLGQNRARQTRKSNALKTRLPCFAIQKLNRPRCGQRSFLLKGKRRAVFFRLAFAFASCAAAVAICLGVWLQFSNDKIEVAKDSTETIAPPIDEKDAKKIAGPISVKKPSISIDEKNRNAETIQRAKNRKSQKSRSAD